MSEQERKRLLNLATWASVLTAGFLVLLKIVAWLMTDSVSLLASLVDSFMDISASIINFFAVRYALTPADDDHSFGHGKVEALAALGQSLFIFGSAIFLLFYALQRLYLPQAITETSVGITVMLVSIVATGALVLFQRYVVAKTKSTAIKADSMHYLTDLASNVVILIAIVLTAYGFLIADPLLALALAIFIFYSAYNIARESIDQLMDKELPEEERQAVEAIIMSVPGVLGFHDFRSWQTGHRKIIQFHLDLDGQQTLQSAHDIAEQVLNKLYEIEPDADITIHEDPVDLHESNCS